MPASQTSRRSSPHSRRSSSTRPRSRASSLEIFQRAGVRAVFAGHYHRNAHGWAGELEMITTGPVGMPLGDDPSGFRIVRVGPHGLDHAYFGLESVPEHLGGR